MAKSKKCSTIAKGRNVTVTGSSGDEKTVYAPANSRLCKFGKRKVLLREGKSNHAAKVARGKALHRQYRCKRNKKTGEFASCELKTR